MTSGQAIPSYKSVAVPEFGYAPVEREGKLYVVRLAEKLTVQTPPMTLTSQLVDADGEALPFATFVAPAHLAAFLKKVEAAVLSACLQHKAEWFKKELDDDALRSGFKSFLRANGTFKVKVPEDCVVFDSAKAPIAPGDVPTGTQVRAVLELAKISFGKTEFGAMWRLVQARTVATPECLIDDTTDDAADDDDIDFL